MNTHASVRRTLSAALYLAAPLGVALAANPETETSITELPPLVVTAKLDLPAAIDPPLAGNSQTYTEDAIRASEAADFATFLSRTGDVETRPLSANPRQSQIAMHGYGENAFGRVKVILDGEDLSRVDMEPPDLSRIPLDALRRIEVHTGPSPVLYGDGAVAGVIRLDTEKSPTTTNRTTLTARVGNWGVRGTSLTTRLADPSGQTDYTGFYDYAHGDGYRVRSAYDQQTFGAGVRHFFENGSLFRLHATGGFADTELPGALTRAAWQAHRRAAAYLHDSCQSWNYATRGEFEVKLSDERSLTLPLIFSQRHRRAHWGDAGYENDYRLTSVAFQPRFVDTSSWGEAENTLTIGSDIPFDFYEVTDRSGYNAYYTTFSRLRGAVFAHDDFALTPTLHLAGGLRAEALSHQWRHVRGLAENQTHQGLCDAELALMWRPDETYEIYTKATRFHRSPFCDEMNYTENGKLLKPETGWSIESGISYQLDETWSAGAHLFGQLTEDEIFYNPHAKDFAGTWGGYNCNSPGRTWRMGFSSHLGWSRDKVAFFSVKHEIVSARFTDGPYAAKDIPLVPQNRLHVRGGFWLTNDLRLSAGLRFVSRERLAGDFENRHGYFPEQFTCDMGLDYEPPYAPGLKLSLSIDNLLNRDFCDFAGWSDYTGAYYYPAAGCSVLFTARYTF